MPRNNSANVNVPSVRVTVLGDRDVGKSALVVRFLTKRFIGEYVSEQEITYHHDVTISGIKAVAEIRDILIRKDQQNHLKQLAAMTDSYLLVYSVCNRESFDHACLLAQRIKVAHLSLSPTDDVPILLVGNKCDLDHFREVKRSEGETFAMSLTSCQFTETSAAESYSDVERTFRTVFQLARSHARSSPIPNSGSGRMGRKNSISQMAQMIRDHYKRGHLTQSPRSNSLERGLTMMKSASNQESINPLSPDFSLKRKIKKHLTHGYTNEHSSAINTAKSGLSSKCQSMGTLNEDASKDKIKIERNSDHMTRDFVKSSNLSKKFVTRDSSNSVQSDVGSPTYFGKISLSSDDAFETSDSLTTEEDAFSSGASSSTVSPLESPTKERRCFTNEDEKSKYTPEAGRRVIINKKNLHLALHSDGEFEDSSCSRSPTPNSAPMLHSTSNQKFRYFPNGVNDTNQDFTKSSKILMSPLLSHRHQTKPKSPKDEKKSPAQSFLKQFFKNTLHISNRNLGSEQSLDFSVSPSPSVASLSDVENGSTDTINEFSFRDRGRKLFHGSSTSLSSVISNDPASVTCSAPTTPQLRKNGRKSRRTSIREAVGVLMRKRKQSISIDCLKHIETKERIL